MNIKDIDLFKLTGKEMLVLNKKMPKPKNEIFTDTNSLILTLTLGTRATLVDTSKWYDGFGYVMKVDSKKLVWGYDATADFVNNPKDYLVAIGDGSLGRKYHNHIDTVWTPCWWGAQMQINSVPLLQRQGWCCTMYRKDAHRDMIADLLQSHHLGKFQGNEYFCYDMGVEYKNLFKFMFRKPSGFLDDKKVSNFVILNKDKNEDKGEMFPDGTLGPWHAESLIELVPEGTVDYFEPTEKIAKSISAGMPFIVVGCHRFLYRLKQMGFKTFNSHIDESYDEEPNWKIRTQMAVESMFQFLESSKDIPSIQKICDHNRLVLSKLRQHSYINRVAKKIRRYLPIDN